MEYLRKNRTYVRVMFLTGNDLSYYLPKLWHFVDNHSVYLGLLAFIKLGWLNNIQTSLVGVYFTTLLVSLAQKI
jgi:hypothetical protein